MGAVVLGKKTIPEALIYIISQVIGASLGYGMLKVGTRMSDSANLLITRSYVYV